MPDNENLPFRVQRMRRRLVEQGPHLGRTQGDFDRVTLPQPDCDLLRDLLVANSAQSVIEIGLAYGSSALAIAEALLARDGETTHLIIDPYQEQFRNVGWQAVASAGLADRCTLLAERSQLALPRLVTEHVLADAAFVDGSHIFHNVFVDLFFLRELVRPGGLVILDDCQWPSVATAARYFERNAGWLAEQIGHLTRLRCFRLPDPPVDPSFEDFQAFHV